MKGATKDHPSRPPVNSNLEPLMVPIDSLSHDPHNARKHGRRNLDAIKFSLERFGQQKPIVIKDGIVIAGNGMMEAAKELGWKEIAAVSSDIDDPVLLKAYGIADNRTQELSEFDPASLMASLTELEMSGMDLPDLGFDPDDLVEIYGADNPGGAAEDDSAAGATDETPDLPTEAISEEGDVWQLGRHRLYCGPCQSLENEFEGNGGMLIADPPYEMEDFSWIAQIVPMVKEGFAFFLLDDHQVPLLFERAAGLSFDRFFILNHTLAIPRGTDAYWQHIMMPRFRIGNPKKQEVMNDSLRSIIPMKYRGSLRSDEELFHKHQKPVALFNLLLKHYSEPDAVVIDPFLGSGSVLIACEESGRTCVGSELDPAFCDVIVKRWEALTGEKAETHDGKCM